MKLKDFVKVIVFSVIGFVLMMIGNYAISIFGVYGTYIHTALATILAAPIFVAMCRKVPKRGTVFVFYLISGMIYSIMGMWPMLIVLLGSGILGELIIGKKENYHNNTRVGISYIVGQLILSLHGVFFIVFIGVQGLAKQFPTMFTVERAQQVKDFFLNTTNLSIVLIIQLLCSVLGAYIGIGIYNKYFDSNKSKKKSVFGE